MDSLGRATTTAVRPTAPGTPTGMTVEVSATTLGSVKIIPAAVAGATSYILHVDRRNPNGTFTLVHSSTRIVTGTAGGSLTERTIEVTGLVLGTYRARATPQNPGGSGGEITRSFVISQIVVDPEAPPPVLTAVPFLSLYAERNLGGVYQFRSTWGRVSGADQFDLSSSPLLTGGSGTTTANSKVFPAPADGVTTTLTVRPRNSPTGTLGPPRSVSLEARRPTIAVGTGTNVVSVFYVTIQSTAIAVTPARFAAISGITRFRWRVRTATGTTDLRNVIGTVASTVGTFTGLTANTQYRIWIAAVSGTTGVPSTVYPETMITVTTARAAARSTGASRRGWAILPRALRPRLAGVRLASG